MLSSDKYVSLRRSLKYDSNWTLEKKLQYNLTICRNRFAPLPVP